MRKKKTALIVCVVMLALLGLACVLSVGEVQKLFYPREYTEYVTAYAAEYGVPEPLVYAVIRAESGFDERAESRVGAKGLMQMMPDTLDWLSRLIGEETPTDIFDPEKLEAIMKEHTDYKGINFQKEIGGTIYEVSSCFNPNGRESLFQQFLKLILSQEIDE